MWHTVFSTPFGAAALAWHDAGLLSFDLPEVNAADLERVIARRGQTCLADEIPAWVAVIVLRVQRHFGGVLQDFSDAPLEWSRVSDFQRDVYRHAQAIKPGSTRSYGDIARAMALPAGSARAVGVALGSNPWPLLVPCHRVVSATGKMTGFSAPGGIRTKTRLLALEGAELVLE